MKKRFFCFVFFFLCFLIISCKKEKKHMVEIPLKQEPQMTLSKDSVDADQWEPLNSKERSESKLTLNSGKELTGLVKIGYDDPFYCNRTENISMSLFSQDRTQIMVCKDPVYEITYFVNYGRDNYIYAIRNNQIEIAVEIQGKELFCREGILYFIAENSLGLNLDGFSKGNVLSYNPLDGRVEVVISERVEAMRVYPDAIYCQLQVMYTTEEGRKTVDREVHVYSFAEKKIIETYDFIRDKNILIDRYQDKDILEQKVLLPEDDPRVELIRKKGRKDSIYETEYYLVSQTEGKSVEIFKDEITFPDNSKIVGNDLYYISHSVNEIDGNLHSTFVQYNLQTKEKKILIEDSFLKQCFSFFVTNDAVVFNGRICFSFKDNEVYYINDYEKERHNFTYRCLFTDGDFLFGIYDEKIWIVILEKKEDDESKMEAEIKPYDKELNFIDPFLFFS